MPDLIVKINRGQFKRGHNPWNKGKTGYTLVFKNPEERAEKISEAKKGRLRLEETKRRISETLKGRHLSVETRKKMSKAQKGRHHLEDTKRKIAKTEKGRLGGMKNKHHSEETKKKQSDYWKRKFVGGYRVTHPKLRFITELGHGVRSSWEEEVCKTLKRAKIPYGYESRRFSVLADGIQYTYIPDLIINNGTVIEIKGRLFDDAKKLKAFHEQYPEFRFIIVGTGSPDLCDVHIPWTERHELIGELRNGTKF